jgi:UDP-GlcNAc:undecaprenyl-phosphate GlcNAc-1-phosphate transferase
MFSLVFVAILSFLLSLGLTRLFRDCFVRLGIVDLPDSRRKLHARAVPRMGGVAIASSYVLTYVVLVCSPLAAGLVVESHLPFIWKLMPAMGAIFLTGLADDLFDLRPWMKLAGQVSAGALAWWGGVRIDSIVGHACPGWLALPLTVAWLVLCANAFNLIDGVDGLAAGVGILASVTTFLAALLQDNLALALATIPLIGSLAGFLPYNFTPASIFLGDSGSLLIGFLLGSYGVIWSEKSATMLGMAAPMMALALPLLDVCLSVVRRFLNNEPIFTADRGHIHHRLLDRGFTPRRVALLLYGACGIGATFSLLQSVLRNQFAGAVIVMFGAATWIGVQYLGYVEFEATRRFLWGGLRPMLSAHVKLEALERALLSAPSVEQCWEALEAAAHALGYSQMNAKLAARRYGATPERQHNAAFWQMRLTLSGDDYVEIAQRPGAPEHPVLLIPFVEIIRRILPGKLIQLAGPPSAAPAMSSSLRNLAAAVEGSRQPAPSRSYV